MFSNGYGSYRSYNPLFDTSSIFHVINTLPQDNEQTFDESFDLPNLSARYEPNNSSARHQTTIPHVKYYNRTRSYYRKESAASPQGIKGKGACAIC